MDCAEFKSFVHVYIDGEFADHERGEADAHLGSCADCRALAAFEAEFRDAVKSAAARGTTPAPAALRASIVAQLAAEPAPGVRRLFKWSYAPVPLAAAAAAAGLVLYTGALRENFAPDLVAGHLQSAGLPLDYPCNSPASCAEWTRGKLGFNARLPVFSAGFMPVGVRVSNVRERPAANVQYYAAPGHRVSLVIFRDERRAAVTGSLRMVEGREVFLATERGFNVVQWNDDEVVYSLVSDLDKQNVLDLVKSTQER
jgi:anti-sigma factor RsiW